ncbi:protein kinase domain-containing protein [Streptomyces longispororuber]|uniref:serine/threonine-protein kinase n=1 Tax=Streptomyces longispororuber TaxID=68230 RepID=UPI00210D3F05|nr:serine/threonine-protein kinase [Streptomyces longispororuber]MCQ4208314.1 serine/threonine-protein kinase [Streptomyces longispororuber]
MPDSPVQPLLPADPARVGPFTLLGRLGGGGMGTVYLARSPGGRVVALKTVHEHLAREAEFRMRFRLEAEAARTIGALHGTAVVDADTQAAMPWLATEYVLGPSLDETVGRHGPLPETAVRALGARLARALGDIHGAGLVHRDLKPSNVLVTATGPRVIDFGIARALGARRLTRSGQAVGTPAYMSPEQAMGLDHEPPGDVFALAGVLVFAVTGHGPFPGGPAAEVLYRVRYGDPDLTRVPEALLPLLTRCLAKDPGRRPRPADLEAELGSSDSGSGVGSVDFASTLPGTVLGDIGRRAAGVWELRPVRAPGPPPPPPRTETGPARRRLLMAGGAGLLALGTGGAVWAARGDGGSGRPRAAASRAPGTAPEALWTYRAEEEATLAGVKDGVVVVIVGDVEEQRSSVGLDARTGTVLWRQPNPVTFEAAGGGAVVRGTPDPAVGSRLLALDVRTGRLRAYGDELGRLPNGELLAMDSGTLYLTSLSFSQGDGWALVAYEAATGERQWLVRHKETDDQPHAAVVEGETLICNAAWEVVALGRKDGKQRWRTRFDETSPTLGKMHPRSLADGRLFLGGGDVLALDTATGKTLWRFGEERKRTTEGRSSYGTPAVHDGVVYVNGLAPRTRGVTGLHTLLALRASDGRELWSYPVGDQAKYWPPPTARGGTLYQDTGAVPQPLLAVDLEKHRPPWTYRSGIPDDGHAALSPLDGRTSLLLAAGRLHLTCGTSVVTLPADG